MKPFLMHVGHRNAIDLDWTVSRNRRIDEIASQLPEGPEKDFFERNGELHRAFPNGEFNCWGVPERAEPAHRQTEVGDLVLFAPHIGIHGGGIKYLGVTKVVPSGRFPNASRLLWPETPDDRIFPWLFFFDTEEGFLFWYEFLSDAGYKEGWNPKGWYKYLKSAQFLHYGGTEGYLNHLRSKGFQRIG